MAKPFGFTRLDRSDMPEMAKWFEQPLYVYNLLLDFINQFSNRGVTYTENIACQIKEVQFTTPATYSSGAWNSIRITSTLATKAMGIQLLQMYATDDINDATLGGGTGECVLGHWNEVDGVININWIGGLANSTKYTVRFLIF